MNTTIILNKVDILAKALQICFISYGVDNNKTLKLQLKTLFHCLDEEREAAINDLINSYDFINSVYENWEWFKQQAFNLISKKLW